MGPAMAVNEAVLINAGLQAGLVDAETISRLRPVARAQRMSLLDAVTRELRLPPAAFWQSLARLRGLPWLDLEACPLDEESYKRLPATLLQKHGMLPVKDAQGGEWLVLGDPDDRVGLAAVARLLNREPRAALADPDALAAAIRRETGRGPLSAARPADEGAIGLFDRLMKEAWLRRATDIHVEAGEGGHGIRLRVDGEMQEWGLPLPRAQGESLISRIKVLGHMDISESRAAQDGGMAYRIEGWDGEAIDIRAASLPTRHGERVTLRLLGSGTAVGAIALDALGMPVGMLTRFREVLAQPHGIVLVTGPTGSGKSTTLYAALRELDRRRLNILTVEDPVEQQLDGISQVGVSNKVGFADALRAFLRHDPDIILVGEVRDADTADTALKAAATGHLVLSTLHTNSAAGAVTRLADIGCERYMLADTLAGVLAQRLVRRLCVHCRREVEADDTARRLLGLAQDARATHYEATGCPHCLGSGYRGRVGLYEALWPDAELAEAIAAGAPERRLAELARAAGRLFGLTEDARAKVRAGLTTVHEVRHLLARVE